MKCSNCGRENNEGKYCEECGFPLDNISEPISGSKNDVLSDSGAETEGGAEAFSEENFFGGENLEIAPEIIEEEEYDVGDEENAEDGRDPAASEALENLKKFEEGTITHPDEKPKQKRKFYCPRNPMLWSFLWLLLFGAVLGALSVFFFNVDLDGTQIVFGTVFCVFTAAVLAIDFVYYFPAALTLDKLLKGKGARLEYRLKKHELVELAEKAKKRNRGFYIAISLFGLAFSVYYIYILANAMVKTNLMWISLFFSIGVFAVFALLFFVMPKFNYERMMQNGERVIVGNKSVYYGGTYYHWIKIRTEATYGTLNTKRHRLEIIFTQELKNGDTKRRKVELYAPDTAIRDITRLLNEYEESAKKYRETQSKSSVITADGDKTDKNDMKNKRRKHYAAHRNKNA